MRVTRTLEIIRTSVAVSCLVASAATSQQAPSSNRPAERDSKSPVFPSQAEAITVDVVVLGKDGHPVADLQKEDFTVFEDGRPVAIVGFEPRALLDGPPGPSDDLAREVVSNERPAAAAGRTLVFVIDDSGIEPLHMTDAAKALGHWLDHGADPRDEVTLVTTSGDAWWSDSVGSGRADLQAVLARLKGKKALAAAQDAISDWEAYRIDTYGSPIVQAEAPSGPPAASGGCTTNTPASDVRERVIDRWFRSGACICDPINVQASISSCRVNVEAQARQVLRGATQRAGSLLAGVERVSRGLAGARGRKSVIVLSEGLLRDVQQSAFERALDASRRGNTAVSFVDVRGLVPMPFYRAEQGAGAVPKPGEIGVMTLEAAILETAGGEYLADATGGSMLRDSNDLAGSVARLAEESSVYYLLGYQTDRRPDGHWHKLQVKVARPGAKVLTRQGYFATADGVAVADPATAKGKPARTTVKHELPVRALDPALAVGGDREQVPLRIAPHLMETAADESTRVLVAIEVGTQSLSFTAKGNERVAQLDVTVIGVSRDRAKTASLDAHVALNIDSRAVGGWWTFSRELRLAPGPAQVRVLLRDTTSGASGLVTVRLDVPPPGGPRLSTPILTDRTRPAEGGYGPRRLVPIAHRSFAPKGSLLCAYEVYLVPGGRELEAVPQVTGAYSVEDADGRALVSEPPTPIMMALGAHIVRTLSIPLDRLAPGSYRLKIRAADAAQGIELQSSQGFVVEAPPLAKPN